MGFHPTEEEIENMINEVKFSKVDTTGQIVTEIDMEGLVKRKNVPTHIFSRSHAFSICQPQANQQGL